MSLVPVPSLDELARDPGRAAGLAPEVARTLFARCVVVQGALLAPALAAAGVRGADTGPDDGDELLTLKEAAQMIGRNPRWFTRQRRQLPFVKRLSPRTLLVSKPGLLKWIAAQRS